MTKSILTLLLLTAACFTLSAEIAVLGTTHSDDPNGCNGTITVRATGTAGPFTVYMYDHVNGIEIEHTDISGDLVLDALCNASYDVVVYPTRFPSCSKSMKAFVKDEKASKVELMEEGVTLVSGELLVKVSPNPSTGLVEVTATGLPLAAAAKVGGWSVSILDATGKSYRQEGFPAVADKNKASFPFDLKALQKGLYFIRVIRSDGAEGTGKVLLQ
jgi:hypothetical protein